MAEELKVIREALGAASVRLSKEARVEDVKSALAALDSLEERHRAALEDLRERAAQQCQYADHGTSSKAWDAKVTIERRIRALPLTQGKSDV